MQISEFSSAVSILRFWHKAEFFLPFDLQKQILDGADEWSVRCFKRSALVNAQAQHVWKFCVPDDRRVTGFDVYFGIFDKQTLTTATQQVLNATLSEDEQLEQQEKHELDGLTCIARIKFNSDGEPLFGEVAVSSAPWAVGKIVHSGLTALNFDVFQHSVGMLKQSLQTFLVSQQAADETCEMDVAELQTVHPMSGNALLGLLEEFLAWSGHVCGTADVDQSQPVLAIRARSVEIPQKPTRQTVALSSLSDGVSPAVTDTLDGEADAQASDADEDSQTQVEIDILNSFYVQDIAAVIEFMEAGQSSAVLNAYLNPLPKNQRCDLYSASGRRYIAQALAPQQLPYGHWLDEPTHAMSLMQQLAINAIFHEPAVQKLFSVNGPPGTGKTTLLKDVFAENIVRRAQVLSGLAQANHAFQSDGLKIQFDGVIDTCYVSRLIPELTGYEMVVASSNNAAVENISLELQKTQALSSTWREAQGGKAKLGYLREVAHNIAARNAKGEYVNLPVNDTPWGMVACALGNKKNRACVASGLRFDTTEIGLKQPKGYDATQHQSLWTWRKKYQGASFAEAKTAFTKLKSRVEARQAQLSEYVQLMTTLRGVNLALFCEHERSDCAIAQTHFTSIQSALKTAAHRLQIYVTQVALLQEEERLILQTKPHWWTRWFKPTVYRTYQQELLVHRQQLRQEMAQQRAAMQMHSQLQQAHEDAQAALERAQQALQARENLWASQQTSLQQLAQAFPQIVDFENLDDLELPCRQVGGLWCDSELNQLRSELFARALELHEAWLAEVLVKRGGLGGAVVAIGHLLDGKRVVNPAHLLPIWQSLFMIIPLVSSTFASFASQFRGLPQASLGWVLIDEAGQAVPQAAVGALWRAKRAVVVGDPLQIEPVFTVPIRLVEALSKTSQLPSNFEVNPHRVSVQNLADAANPLGTQVMTDQQTSWVGSPLRVHRRCVDPMFSVANAIAYANKMVFHGYDDPAKRQPHPSSIDIGSSAWVQVPGRAYDRQAVREQIECVQQALALFYAKWGALPPVYIITPFRRIKTLLVERMRKPASWRAQESDITIFPQLTQKAIQSWCQRQIGTVHTFQGKQQSIVWLVLGCDEASAGAARWVASKPNLLNVALTRAQERVFIIGDCELWGGLPYFSTLLAQLDVPLTADLFQKRIAQLDKTPLSHFQDDTAVYALPAQPQLSSALFQ